jgi:tryptophan 2,3-dioxygenase
MSDDTLDYSSYLKVRELTSLQHLMSVEKGEPAHVEMLYIVVHQVYELWFKTILHELDSVIDIFDTESQVQEGSIATAVRRLERITRIQRLLLEQVDVLETMTPLDFLDFRHHLGSASGFQSFQFRLLENRLGLRAEDRMEYGGRRYSESFRGEEKDRILASESAPSLMSVIAAWLERTPFMENSQFSFKDAYATAVKNMLAQERQLVDSSSDLDDDMRKLRLEGLTLSENESLKFLDESEHNKLVKKNLRRLSYKATLASLFINLYREEPILFQPFRLIETIMEIDENFVKWRSRHALMVHRMLGKKVGTGASSGYDYLKRTAERYRVFQDFFHVSTYLVPRTALPELPKELKKKLSFHYSVSDT